MCIRILIIIYLPHILSIIGITTIHIPGIADMKINISITS